MFEIFFGLLKNLTFHHEEKTAGATMECDTLQYKIQNYGLDFAKMKQSDYPRNKAAPTISINLIQIQTLVC